MSMQYETDEASRASFTSRLSQPSLAASTLLCCQCQVALHVASLSKGPTCGLAAAGQPTAHGVLRGSVAGQTDMEAHRRGMTSVPFGFDQSIPTKQTLSLTATYAEAQAQVLLAN